LGKPVQEELNGNGDQYEAENSGGNLQAVVTETFFYKSRTEKDDAGYQGYGQDHRRKQHVIHAAAGLVGIKDYCAHGPRTDEDRDSQGNENLVELQSGLSQMEVIFAW
jgi:hypothetical protein